MRVSKPTPTVTAANVERVAQRDFPPGEIPTVMQVLGEYGKEEWQREEYRVRLAVLKLARGKIEDLKYWTEQAKRDYRDVLGPAEYPLYGKKWGRMDRLSEEEQKKIIQSDWTQYEKWLKS